MTRSDLRGPVARRPSRRLVLAASATLLAAAPLGNAWAQAWPTKPVTIVVPFPAGGGTDAFARPLFATLGKNTGKQFVIDNRGGAGGTLEIKPTGMKSLSM